MPDVQCKPGDDMTHLDWAGQAIVDYKPDVIVVIGDFWDMPSLSTHSGPGNKEAEGQRVHTDIEAGNEAFERLWSPVWKYMQARVLTKRRRYYPECHFFTGNHEDRITRAVFNDPKWDGLLGLHSLAVPQYWVRHPFLKIVDIDGIAYSHYFANPFSGRPIAGTIISRLNNIGKSFVQGHQQGFLYASKQYPDHEKHGLVAGRFYNHTESYRAPDVQESEWNGICVLNEVECHNRNGKYDLMKVSMNYLRRKYG